MIRVLVHGAKGRMGSRICSLAEADERFELVATEAGGDPRDAAGGVVPCDVVIDFTSPTGARKAAELAARGRSALLVGTTGLPPETLDLMDDLARSVPVMIAANTARSVAVLNHIAAEAARLLAGLVDVDVIETHHTAKRDAPSGTALRLARVLRERAGIEVEPGRIHSVRAGDVVGEHTVSLVGKGERLTILHAISTRDVFATGALTAAAWLCGRPPGRYAIEQVWGLAASSPSTGG